MGELFRRFWLPAMLPSELPEADCPPVRLRLLGEDLVAFRDSNGEIGVVEAHCPHRGASLYFRRNEECGIRCVYHGWKFDVAGNCVDLPSEPAESNFKDKIHITAYPTALHGGLIWVYMGPKHLHAELPNWSGPTSPIATARCRSGPGDQLPPGYEGDIDSSHASFLHTYLDPAASPNARDHHHRSQVEGARQGAQDRRERHRLRLPLRRPSHNRRGNLQLAGDPGSAPDL